MEQVYCKYCGKYKPKKNYSVPKGRCDACERHARDRFDKEQELEQIYKTLQDNAIYQQTFKLAKPVSDTLKEKRRKRAEQLDLLAIEEDYVI